MVHRVMSVSVRNTFFEDRIIINGIQDNDRNNNQKEGIRAYGYLTSKILRCFNCFGTFSEIQEGEKGTIYLVNTNSYKNFKARTGYIETTLRQQETVQCFRHRALATVREEREAGPLQSPQAVPAAATSTADSSHPQPIAATAAAETTPTNPHKKTKEQIIKEITIHLRRDLATPHAVGHCRREFDESYAIILKHVADYFIGEGFKVKMVPLENSENNERKIHLEINLPDQEPSLAGPLLTECRDRFRQLTLKEIREWLQRGPTVEYGIGNSNDNDAEFIKSTLTSNDNCEVVIYKHVENAQTKNMHNGKHYYPGNYLTITHKNWYAE